MSLFFQYDPNFCRKTTYSKKECLQILETVPPRKWIVRTIEILDAVEEEDLSNTLHNSDAYRKLLREVSNLSLEEPYWGKTFDGFGFISFFVERKGESQRPDRKL
jgi:hypothetical protein